MKKLLSFILIISLLSLSGCSDGADIDMEPPSPADETTAAQSSPAETYTAAPTLLPDGYIRFGDLDRAQLYHLYTDEELDRDYPMAIPGFDNVIFCEMQWQDYTIQFIADHVHKRENAQSDSSLFLEAPRFKVFDGNGNETGEGVYHKNVRHASGGGHFAYELYEDDVKYGYYLRIYTMRQNGREYPLIVTLMNTMGEEKYDVNFYTLNEEGVPVLFYSELPEEVRPLVCDREIEDGLSMSMGMVLPEGWADVACTMTYATEWVTPAMSKGVKFTFDFKNYTLSAQAWSDDEYFYPDEVDLSYLYEDGDIGVMNASLGIDNVILHEAKWQDSTIQLIGGFVHKRASAPENTLFADVLIRMLDSDGNVSVTAGDGSETDWLRIPTNVRRHGTQIFYYELDADRMSDYLRIYTMTQNGREYPLIVTMLNKLDEDDYDTTFFTVTESGELTGIYGSTDDEEIRELILADGMGGIGGVVLSGDFTVDSENRTLTDNKLGVRFSFDFADTTFGNIRVTAEFIN